jgi:hypothetical protein
LIKNNNIYWETTNGKKWKAEPILPLFLHCLKKKSTVNPSTMKGRERKKEITQKIVSEGDHSLLNISTDITLVDSNIIKLVLYLLFEREAHFSFFPFFFLSQVLSYDFFFRN